MSNLGSWNLTLLRVEPTGSKISHNTPLVDFVSGGPLRLDDKLGLVWNLRLAKYSFSSNQTGFGLVFDTG